MISLDCCNLLQIILILIALFWQASPQCKNYKSQITVSGNRMSYQSIEEPYEVMEIEDHDLNLNVERLISWRFLLGTIMLILLSVAPVAIFFSRDKMTSSIENYSDVSRNPMSPSMSLFNDFCDNYNKSYSGKEFTDRYEIFLSNVKRAQERNQIERNNGGTAAHGLTKYVDLTIEEFQQKYTGVIVPDSPVVFNKRSILNAQGLTYQNWIGTLTTPIKDQGYCGSCWAVVSSEQLESDGVRLGVLQLTSTQSLGPQLLVNCDTYDGGCNGGWFESAYRWMYDTGGIPYEADYPYTTLLTNSASPCPLTKPNVVMTVHYDSLNSFFEGFSTEMDMANYVLNYGPVSAMIDSSPFQTYTTGIIASCDPILYNIDHAVQIVGVDIVNSYWIVRNSWGTGFGVSGYAFLQFGTNMCGVSDYAHYISNPVFLSSILSLTTTPSLSPTTTPSATPSRSPSRNPSKQPVTKSPTTRPTVMPSRKPSLQPSTSVAPSNPPLFVVNERTKSPHHWVSNDKQKHTIGETM
eukprot:gene2526-4912_t